jgi:hypothetical protein
MVVLTGGCRELDADEGAIRYVDRSSVTNNALLLGGGLDRLAERVVEE